MPQAPTLFKQAIDHGIMQNIEDADQESRESMYNVVRILAKSDDPADQKCAHEFFLNGAEKGHAQAMFEAGNLYYKGYKGARSR